MQTDHLPVDHLSIRQQRRWHIHPSREELERTVAQRLGEESERAIRERGRFHIVLAGGGTPVAVYRQLAGLDTDWKRWWVYFGDERCLPVGDADRNDIMARQAWLEHVPIPGAQIASMPAEQGPVAGATEYSETLRGCGNFDLVLLGMGEDGHTASLFPDLRRPTADDPPALPVQNSPKPPPQRITLSAVRLAQARQVWFLISGESKLEALRRWHHDADLPVSWIRPAAGVDIHTDVDPR